MIGAPAQFVLDIGIRKTGETSLRITASEITRSYIASEPVAVAPGEKLAAKMWARLRDVPQGKGTVIAIAEFLSEQKTQTGVAKIAVAATDTTEWQQLSGTITVPDGTAFLRLRLGFSYSQGTCWWDDVQLESRNEISARFDLEHGRLSPFSGSLPIVVLNRAGRKGASEIRANVAGKSTNIVVDLTGAPSQKVLIPVRVAKPGKAKLQGSISVNGAQVSSLEAEATVPPPLSLDPLVPTHWALEDGKPVLNGWAHIALPASELSKAELQLELVDTAGKGIATTSAKELSDGANEFELAAPLLPEGEYLVNARLTGAGTDHQASQTWAVIPRRKASVAMNEHGFPVCEGRVIFPSGVFNGGARMKELGASGFTVSHSYNTVEARRFGQPDDDRAKAFLDESHRAGLKALMLVPRYALFAPDWKTVSRRILMFRNHPGLLAWDEEEGVARGDIKPEIVLDLSKLIKKLDPHHPLMLGDSKDVIGRIAANRADFFLVDAMDLGMWWWYPFPVTGSSNALEGDEAASPADLPLPAFLLNANTTKPLWVGIQSYRKPGASARYPNRAEYRFQTYAAICAGARGLMWYGGSVTGGAYLNPQEADWDYIKSLGAEVKDLAPVLTGSSQKPPSVSPENAPVSGCIKTGGGRTILFAVNRSMQPLRAAISIPGWKDVLLLPDKTPVPIHEEGIRVEFGPLGVRLYELSNEGRPQAKGDQSNL